MKGSGLSFCLISDEPQHLRLSKVTLPSAKTLTYTYDADGNLQNVIGPDGTHRQYSYTTVTVDGHEEPALLTGLTDENKNAYATWTYDASALAASSEHAGGVDRHTFTYQKDAAGKITGSRVTNPLGAVTQYTFQNLLGASRVQSTRHPLLSNVSQSVTYDANGNILTKTDFNGNLTRYTYDLSSNLETQRVEAAGQVGVERTISQQWHPYWRLPSKIAEANKITTYLYNGDTDSTGTLLSCAPSTATVPTLDGTRPIGVLCRKTEQATADKSGATGLSAAVIGTARTWNWTYNSRGQVLSPDGPRTDLNDLTTYTYYPDDDTDLNKRGRLATVTNALGHLTRIDSYDAHGNPLQITDPNGVATVLTYDDRQRRLTHTVVGAPGTPDEKTTYTYDDVGQITRIDRPDGRFLTYTYDTAHRLTQITDALGNSVLYTLDAMGNRKQEDFRDPLLKVFQNNRRTFDPLGRVAVDIDYPNRYTEYTYDANGNRRTVTDPLAQIRTQDYDAFDRLTQVTDPGSVQTRYAYNGQDRLVQVTDPRGLLTTYTVDGLGNLLEETSPDSGLTRRTFDAAGNERSRRDAKGQLTTFRYDALNRPQTVVYADGSLSRYTWDLWTNGRGHLSQITDFTDTASGNVLFASLQNDYDRPGRLLSQVRRVGDVSHTIRYAWKGDRLTGLTTPAGRTVTYAHDAAGQVRSVTLTDTNGGSRVLADQITYYPFGGVQSYVDGAGQTHRRYQDANGQVRLYTLGAQSWQIARDVLGRVASQTDVTDPANATLTVSYDYDSLGHLVRATPPSTTYGYTWDGSGNRLSQSTGSSTRQALIDPLSNRLQSLGGVPARSYTYDAAGNRQGDGSATYVHDVRGRLNQVTTAAGVTRYTYNGLGERVRKVGGGEDIFYHYDLAGRLLAEGRADGTVTREYLWLDDTLLAVLQ